MRADQLLIALTSAWLLSVMHVLAEGDHDDHDDHGHEEHPWEWVGAFSMDAAEHYTWSAARNETGSYADASMKLVIYPISSADDAGVHDVAEKVENLWKVPDDEWLTVTSATSLRLDAAHPHLALKLQFNSNAWMSLFYLTFNKSGSYAFFAEHFPVEFENEFHYLRDEHGDDVEPLFTEPASAEPKDGSESASNWGVSIGGAFLTTLPALFMIAVIGPRAQAVYESLLPSLFSFAAGAMTSCAVLLMLPEGLHLASVGYGEAEGAALWGSAIMAGWLLGLVCHYVGQMLMTHTPSPSPDLEINEDSATKQKVGMVKEPVGLLGVIFPVAFGDFWHNFVDGLVIAFSANSCSSALTWSIIGVSIAHELPQEIGDFIILVNKAGMKWHHAIFVNFFAAQGAVIGAIFGCALDVSSNVQGFLLAFGSGVYLYIAMTELAPQIVEMKVPSPLESTKRVLGFGLGAILIGLALLDHEHCIAETDGDAGAHAGHNH